MKSGDKVLVLAGSGSKRAYNLVGILKDSYLSPHTNDSFWSINYSYDYEDVTYATHVGFWSEKIIVPIRDLSALELLLHGVE